MGRALDLAPSAGRLGVPSEMQHMAWSFFFICTDFVPYMERAWDLAPRASFMGVPGELRFLKCLTVGWALLSVALP